MFKKTNLSKSSKKVVKKPDSAPGDSASSPASDERFQKRLRAYKAMQMRVSGKEWEEIGEELNVPPGAARNMAASYMKKMTDEKAEEYRSIALRQINSLVRRTLDLAVKEVDEDGDPVAFNEKAFKAALSAQAERNKIVGAYAPFEVKHTEVIADILGLIRSVVTDAQFTQILQLLSRFNPSRSDSGVREEEAGRGPSQAIGLPN